MSYLPLWLRRHVRALIQSEATPVGPHVSCRGSGQLFSTDLVCPACEDPLPARLGGVRLSRIMWAARLSVFPVAWAIARNWSVVPYMLVVFVLGLLIVAFLRNHITLRNFLLVAMGTTSLYVFAVWFLIGGQPAIFLGIGFAALIAIGSIIFPFLRVRSVWHASLIAQAMAILWGIGTLAMLNIAASTAFNLGGLAALGGLVVAVILSASPHTIPHAFRMRLKLKDRYVSKWKWRPNPRPLSRIDDVMSYPLWIRPMLTMMNRSASVIDQTVSLLIAAVSHALSAASNFLDHTARSIHRSWQRVVHVITSYLSFVRFLSRSCSRIFRDFSRVFVLPVGFLLVALTLGALMSRTITEYVGSGNQISSPIGWWVTLAMAGEAGGVILFVSMAISTPFRNRGYVFGTSLELYLSGLALLSVFYATGVIWSLVLGPVAIENIPNLPGDAISFLSSSPYDIGPATILTSSATLVMVALVLLNHWMGIGIPLIGKLASQRSPAAVGSDPPAWPSI